MPQVIVGLLLYLTTSFVGRVLTALGLSFVTYEGFTLVTDKIIDSFEGALFSLPSDVMNFALMMKLDVCFSLTLSTLAVKWAVSGISGGSKKVLGRS